MKTILKKPQIQPFQGNAFGEIVAFKFCMIIKKEKAD